MSSWTLVNVANKNGSLFFTSERVFYSAKSNLFQRHIKQASYWSLGMYSVNRIIQLIKHLFYMWDLARGSKAYKDKLNKVLPHET